MHIKQLLNDYSCEMISAKEICKSSGWVTIENYVKNMFFRQVVIYWTSIYRHVANFYFNRFIHFRYFSGLINVFQDILSCVILYGVPEKILLNSHFRWKTENGHLRHLAPKYTQGNKGQMADCKIPCWVPLIVTWDRGEDHRQVACWERASQTDKAMQDESYPLR